jgi:hypothetical protein
MITKVLLENFAAERAKVHVVINDWQRQFLGHFGLTFGQQILYLTALSRCFALNELTRDPDDSPLILGLTCREIKLRFNLSWLFLLYIWRQLLFGLLRTLWSFLPKDLELCVLFCVLTLFAGSY